MSEDHARINEYRDIVTQKYFDNLKNISELFKSEGCNVVKENITIDQMVAGNENEFVIAKDGGGEARAKFNSRGGLQIQLVNTTPKIEKVYRVIKRLGYI